MDAKNFDYPTGNTTDGRTENIDIIIGGDFAEGRGNATVYGTWREGEPVMQGNRDYSSCALNGASTSCGGSGNAIIPNFYITPELTDSLGVTRGLIMQVDMNIKRWQRIPL